jgi:hypothetical protein
MISDAVGDVKSMAQAMQPVLVQQTEQITRVTARVDEADQRLVAQNARMRKLL